MFNILCIQFRIVTVPYFLDEMPYYEALDILHLLPNIDRGEWERCRYNMWLTAQVNSTKKINLEDIMKFEWEQSEKDTSISNKDIERLKKKADYFKNILNNQKDE